MTIPFWGILYLLVVTFLLAALGDLLRIKEFGEFDNNYPRDQSSKLTELGSRVWAAQQNSWEAIIMYVPSVVVAHLVGVDLEQATIAALVFCVARFFHALFYIVNIGTLRSISYFVAFGCCLRLFWLAGNVSIA